MSSPTYLLNSFCAWVPNGYEAVACIVSGHRVLLFGVYSLVDHCIGVLLISRRRINARVEDISWRPLPEHTTHSRLSVSKCKLRRWVSALLVLCESATVALRLTKCRGGKYSCIESELGNIFELSKIGGHRLLILVMSFVDILCQIIIINERGWYLFFRTELKHYILII